jgi:putative NIF3 family GTP cyclohydrolase 1 type 2
MKATHKRIVGGPYGWQDTCDGIHLEAHAAGQAIVQVAHELKERGLSLRQIGHALTERACIRHQVALGIPRACRTC